MPSSPSSPNYLAFKKASMVTTPVKISIWNVEVYWSLCLGSSTFPMHMPVCSPPIFLHASWNQGLNRWLYLRHQLSYCNRKDSPSPFLLPTTQTSDRQQSKPLGLLPQNLVNKRTAHSTYPAVSTSVYVTDSSLTSLEWAEGSGLQASGHNINGKIFT